jgi:hypothetical protein
MINTKEVCNEVHKDTWEYITPQEFAKPSGQIKKAEREVWVVFFGAVDCERKLTDYDRLFESQ